MNILIVEDDPNRIEWFKNSFHDDILFITKDTKKAIEWLKEESFELIFLDHDLGDEVYVDSGEGTGHEVAEYIADNKLTSDLIVIHTCNPIGAVNMSRTLSDYKLMIIPFPRLIQIDIDDIRRICEEKEE